MAIVQLAPMIKEGVTFQAKNPSTCTSQDFALLSVEKENPTMVITSDLAGKTLKEYIEIKGGRVLGRDSFGRRLPFMIKRRSFKDGWPITIHSDEDRLKMFYILSCQEGAVIYYGFEQEISIEEIQSRMEAGTLLEVMKPEPVQAGQVFVIEPGTIWAIHGEVELIEAEQCGDHSQKDEAEILNSITTTPLESDHFFEPIVDNGQARTILLASSDAFTCFKTECHGKVSMDIDSDSFAVLVLIEGSAIVNYKGKSLHVNVDDTVFMDAGSGSADVVGNCTYLYFFK